MWEYHICSNKKSIELITGEVCYLTFPVFFIFTKPFLYFIMLKKLTFLFLLSVLTTGITLGQDTIVNGNFNIEHRKRNVLKWNLTPMIWEAKNINLSYERVTSPFSSFSINAGYFTLPSTGFLDSINIDRTNKKWGFSISGDKRYYFKKRNKRMAPDGLYWGIFGSIHHYDFENRFSVLDSDIAEGKLNLHGNFSMFSLGVELGYQFVLKNNLTIDLIFIGPSLSIYSAQMDIDGDLKVDKESDYVKAIYDILISKFPGADELLNDKSIKDNGALFSVGPGLRYMIQIGYRF